ncbi:peptidoglycan-binding domain-containing protein [Streptomyces aidingensis]|uniref:Putative peptidoglycan binding domain-containing protein n=1 Tax=Streptomyces aidingensis TaxID=910347 RepID=A0A1I1L4Z4_9ACTN|nr:peptidoglycan-binding domain-containing protein [Streptomyces aidingensis]SFC68061.1 Putative peptidoglycan binding domain-containing protein [Streptomyces aidingensis]
MLLRNIAASVCTAVLAAAGVAVTASTAEAASYPTCNAAKKKYISDTRYVVQPFYERTGSRNCVMGYGAQSAGVVRLQFALNDCYSAISIEEDGIYGRNTRDAVRYAQERGGAGVDGVYGPETRKAMYWGIYEDGRGFRGCGRPKV